MKIYDIITKKKEGLALTEEEIFFTIDGYMKGEIADYQISALLMAICLKGMSREETLFLTSAMLNSGETVDLSAFSGLTVDKHSTGGVGDKTTLIIAPIVASLGCKVAKMSGRGLGFTGGTVDKLESLDGYDASLSSCDFLKQVEEIGVCVIGQSPNLAPADKKLYALRDVTATVDSIPLIASSIMSKKLASGSHSIVLDVKCGQGAFMKEPKDATTLAKAMIDIGNGFGKRVCALVTNMNVPLGYAVGNRTEVWEAVQVLRGKGEMRLTELCVGLATQMVSLALDIDKQEAEKRVNFAITSGMALEKMKEWIKRQGADIKYIECPELLLNAKHTKDYFARESGYIEKIQADMVGNASAELGAGRKQLGDGIDPTAGIIFHKSFGDFVSKGEKIATLYSGSNDFDSACAILTQAIRLSDTQPEAQKLIYEII